MALCLLKNAILENEFWVRALETAFYFTNRCLTSSLPKWKTPFEMFFGEKPDLSNVRVFECVACKLNKTHQDKLSPKATKELFVGYAPMSNAYILFDPKTGKTSASRNVSFKEHSFLQNPLQEKSSSSESFPIESCGECLGEKSVFITESGTNENLIPSFEPFRRKDFEKSEPHSVPSSQTGFENSNQNDIKSSVENVEENIVQNTVPQTYSSEYQSFPCSGSGRPLKPPLRFQNYVNPDDVEKCLLSEDI